MTTLIIVWYTFCSLLIGGLLWTMRHLTHQKFRDDEGDATTEIGYEEDSEGHNIYDYAGSNLDKKDPHVTTPEVTQV